MTKQEYANIMPGDVIFNMENNKAQVVSVVNDGYVSWREGGSTPKSHLLEWHYASLMRERNQKV